MRSKKTIFWNSSQTPAPCCCAAYAWGQWKVWGVTEIFREVFRSSVYFYYLRVQRHTGSFVLSGRITFCSRLLRLALSMPSILFFSYPLLVPFPTPYHPSGSGSSIAESVMSGLVCDFSEFTSHLRTFCSSCTRHHQPSRRPTPMTLPQVLHLDRSKKIYILSINFVTREQLILSLPCLLRHAWG